MLADLGLMSIHARALFTRDAGSRLLSVNEPGGASAPAARLFLGRTRAGNVWAFRAGLPADLVRELDSLCADEPPLSAGFNVPPRHAERYVRLLEGHAPGAKASAGPAYRFPESIEPPSGRAVALTTGDAEKLRGGFEEMIAELPVWQPFVALIEGGRAVAVCRSVRLTPEAHEAGVETLPDFRGRGYAGVVVAAWALRVRAARAIPLYSTSWENKASQAVARKLGMECYGADFEVA
jgi:GNAT superfamily N-acetyltransferase